MEAPVLADVPFAANPTWYRRITAALREVYWVGNVERTRFIYVSPAFEELWGLPVEALYDDPTVWLTAIHPVDRKRTIEAMYSGDEGEVEYRIVRADGAVRWMHTRFFTTLDEVTGAPSVVGVSADITTRREAQDQLARQERVLRGVARATHALLTIPDFADALTRAFSLLGEATGVDRIHLFENHRCPETGLLLTSQRYEWALGSAGPRPGNPELQGVPYAGIVPRWEAVLERGDAVYGLVRDLPANERAVLEPTAVVSVLIVPVTMDGAFWGFVGFDDCTAERTWSEGERSVLTIAASSLGSAFARERGGTALRESEAQYRHLVDTIREVVFQTDAEGRWSFLNPAWTDITGFPVEQSLGEAVLDYVHPDDRALNAETFAPLIARQKAECRHTVRYLTRDGGVRWIEVTARLVLDADDGIAGTAGTLADVTEQRQAMAALEATLERERELGELKTRFVSMASHELRTPLAAIQSSAELVGRFVARGDMARVDKHLARIRSNVGGMTELLEDVLLMGKAEEGQLAFDPQPIELGAALHEVVEQVRLGVGARHRFVIMVPDEPVLAVADRKLLHLALGNLLSNAVKYAEPGTRIEVALDVDGDAVAVAVRDQGIGIPATDVPHLFEAFHRASNVGTRRGTGLGLAIVQRAVDLHGGRVEVASVAGEGSTFTLRIPLVTP